MKKILFISTVLLLLASFDSCKKTDYPPFYKESCRVLSTGAAEPDGGFNATYTYDADGYISSETTNLYGMIIEYKYKRKRNGELESAETFYAGNYNGTQKFTYSNGRVIKLEGFYEDFPMGNVSSIKYNSRGLITEITQESEYNPESNMRKNYEYDALGQVTKKTTSYFNGSVIRLEVHKNTGSSSPSSAVYLSQHGLPFQILFLYPYEYSNPGIGSSTEIYSPDAAGNMALECDFLLKAKELDARGYTASITTVCEKDGYTSIFSAQYDCSKHDKMK